MSTVLRPSAAGGPPLPATNLLLQHQQQVAKARSTIAANGVATYDEENQRPNAGPRSLSVSHKLYGHDDKENAAVARSTRARTNNMTMMMGQQPQTTSLMHQKPRRVLQEIKPDNGASLLPSSAALSASTARRTGAQITAAPSSSHLTTSSHSQIPSAIPSLANLTGSQRLAQQPRSMSMTSSSLLSSSYAKQPHVPLAQQHLSSFSGPSMASHPSSVLSVSVTSSTSSSASAAFPPTHSHSATGGYLSAPNEFTVHPNFTSSTLSSFCAASEVSQLTAVQEKAREIEQERRMLEALAPVQTSQQPQQHQQQMYVESSVELMVAMESDEMEEAPVDDVEAGSQATQIYADDAEEDDTSGPCDVNTSSVILDASAVALDVADPTAGAMDLCSSPVSVERGNEMDLTNLSASLNGASSSARSPFASASSSIPPSAFGSVPASLPPEEAHLWAAELTDEIVAYWFDSESKHRASPDYLTHQPDLNGKMREILIDWLQEVVARFRLQTETMFLAVGLLDRFLSCKAVGRKKLQLVGCVALLLAAKYEEIYIPAINDFLIISDNAYSRDHVLHMESIMLNGLNFQLTQVTSLRFMQRFLNLPDSDFIGPAVREGIVLPVFLAQYLLELTLQYVKFLEYRPSTVAAAVVYIVGHHAHVEHMRHQQAVAAATDAADPAATAAAAAIPPYEWSASMILETRHTVDDLRACVGDVYAHWQSMSEIAASAIAAGTVASGGPGNKCLAIYRKYGKERLGQVNQAHIHKPTILE